MRTPLALLGILTLAACNSTGGGGYDPYASAAPQGSYGAPAAGYGAIVGGPISSGTIGSEITQAPAASGTGPYGGSAAATAAAQALGVSQGAGYGATSPTTAGYGAAAANTGYAGATASAASYGGAAAATGAAVASGISDENDFSAVSQRESIASDKARIEANRATYQQVAPTALPQRAGAGPNIVAYALSVNHAPGQVQYRRLNPLRNMRYEAACAKYASQDLAQIAFLERGGPDRDPLSLDPDGDGFACRWDPTPFQQAAR